MRFDNKIITITTVLITKLGEQFLRFDISKPIGSKSLLS